MLEKHYKEKLCRITEQRCTSDGRGNGCNKINNCQDYRWKGHNHSNHHPNYDKCEKKQEDMIPSYSGDKVFMTCPTHRQKSNHTFKECYKNPKNQDKHQVNKKKCLHESHHNDACYTSDDDELSASVDTPVPSEDQASVLSEDKINKDENHLLHTDKN
jgi:hypothetical protein